MPDGPLRAIAEVAATFDAAKLNPNIKRQRTYRSVPRSRPPTTDELSPANRAAVRIDRQNQPKSLDQHRARRNVIRQPAVEGESPAAVADLSETPPPAETPTGEPLAEVAQNAEIEIPNHSTRFLYLVGSGTLDETTQEVLSVGEKPEKVYKIVGEKSNEIRGKIQKEKYGHLSYDENQERWATVWTDTFTTMAKDPSSREFFQTLSDKVGIQIDTAKLLNPAQSAEEITKIKAHMKGEFFQEYCATTDGLGKLADKLNVREAIVLEKFIRGVFGGGNQNLYDSFVATVAAKKENMLEIVAKRQAPEELSVREKEILAFLRGEIPIELSENHPVAAEEEEPEIPAPVDHSEAPPVVAAEREEEAQPQPAATIVNAQEAPAQHAVAGAEPEEREEVPDSQPAGPQSQQSASFNGTQIDQLSNYRDALAAQEAAGKTPEMSLPEYYAQCNRLMKELGIKGDAKKMIEGKKTKDIAELEDKLGAYYREMQLFRSDKYGDSVRTFFYNPSTKLSNLSADRRAQLLYASLKNRGVLRSPQVRERLLALRLMHEDVGFPFVLSMGNPKNEVISQSATIDKLQHRLITLGRVDVTKPLLEIINAADHFTLSPYVMKMMRENSTGNALQALDAFEQKRSTEEPIAA